MPKGDVSFSSLISVESLQDDLEIAEEDIVDTFHNIKVSSNVSSSMITSSDMDSNKFPVKLMKLRESQSPPLSHIGK